MTTKAVMVIDQAIPICIYPSKEKSQEKYMRVMTIVEMQPMARMAGFSLYVKRKKIPAAYPSTPAAERNISW